MSKRKLIQKLSEITGKKKDECSKDIELLISAITSVLEEEESITIVNFGTIKRKVLPKRSMISPSSGQKIVVAERVRVMFKASKSLTDTLKSKLLPDS